VLGERATKLEPKPAAVNADATTAFVGPSKRARAMGMPTWLIIEFYRSNTRWNKSFQQNKEV
jgi:hypothetical protein